MTNEALRGCGLVSALLITTTAAGCATGPGVESPAVSSSGADTAVSYQPAELIDCDYLPSPDPDPRAGFVIVTVPVDVDPEGAVERVGAPRAPRGRNNQRVLDRAVALARSCVFEPATRAGNQVSDRAEVQFRLGSQG